MGQTIGTSVILNDYLGEEGHLRMKSLGALIKDNNEGGILDFFTQEKERLRSDIISTNISDEEKVLLRENCPFLVKQLLCIVGQGLYRHLPLRQ